MQMISHFCNFWKKCIDMLKMFEFIISFSMILFAFSVHMDKRYFTLFVTSNNYNLHFEF